MATTESARMWEDEAPPTVRPDFDISTFARKATREPETTTEIAPLALEALRIESSRPEAAEYTAGELAAEVQAAQDAMAKVHRRAARPKRRKPRKSA